MRILDRYVIRNVLTATFWFLLVLLLLRVMIDLLMNMDEFAELDMSSGQMLMHVAGYYASRLAVYFVEMGGLAVVAAAAFTLAMMNHSNELTAMLASGVSLRRVVRPVLIVSVILSGLIMLDQELLIPRLAGRLAASPDEQPEGEDFAVRFALDGNNSVWYSQKLEPTIGRMYQPVTIVRNDQYRALARLSGQWAQQVPGGWEFTDAQLSPQVTTAGSWREIPDTDRVPTSLGPQAICTAVANEHQQRGQHFDPQTLTEIENLLVQDDQYGLTIQAPKLSTIPSLDKRESWQGVLQSPTFTFRSEGGKVLGIFQADRATWRVNDNGLGRWVLENGSLLLPSDLTVEDLKLWRSSRWMDYLSLGELGQLLKLDRVPNPRLASLTRHSRLLNPVYNMVMLLLGLPFILSRERNIKASALLTLLMVGGFFAATYLLRLSGLPPLWSASLPVLIFGPISVVMLDSVKT